MLDVGFSLVTLIEVVPVGWVRVDSVSLSSTEARTFTAITAAAAAAAIRKGLIRVDWRGVRTSTAS